MTTGKGGRRIEGGGKTNFVNLSSSNKKADLLPDNVTSVIIAVLVLLIFALGTLTACNRLTKTDEEKENAKTLITNIETKINSLNAGESNTFNFQDFKGTWYLAAWGKENPNRPNKCFQSGCICISPLPTSESCQENGIKRDIEAKEITTTYYYLLSTFTEGGDIESIKDSTPQLQIPQKFFQLEIIKETDSIKINLYSNDYNDE